MEQGGDKGDDDSKWLQCLSSEAKPLLWQAAIEEAEPGLSQETMGGKHLSLLLIGVLHQKSGLRGLKCWISDSVQ